MTISGIQLFWLMTMFEVGMASYLMVSPTIQRVHNDAWMSLIISGLLGALATWIGIRLGHYYPQKTFIEYVPDIVGSWVGKGIGAVYVLHWFTVTAMVFHQVAGLLVSFQFHTTPIWFFVGTMAFLSGRVLRAGGLRSLGRVCEVIAPLVLVVATAVYLFSLPSVHWKQLMPLYVNSGVKDLFYGSLPAASFLAQSSFITMLYPFIVKPSRNAKMAIWGEAIASVFLVIAAILSIVGFGPNLAGVLWNPVFSMSKYITVGEIFQNTEAFVIIVWFLSAFIRMGLFLFLSVYGFSALFGIKNWKSTIWWGTGITACVAMLPRNVIESTVVYPEKITDPIVLPVLCFGIPVGLWVLARLRSPR